MASLNFNNIQKQYLMVTLNDDKNTILSIANPTKRLLEEFISVQSMLSGAEEGSMEQIDVLYDMCAKLMSRNKGNITITKEKIEELFDIEDIMVLFNAYMEFITNQVNSKN